MGEWAKEVKAKLREENYRLTEQREIICDVFVRHPNRHLTAEEIRNAALEQKHLGLATVYRTLAILEDIGLVKRIDIGDGTSRYEYVGADSSPHCHLICLRCGGLRGIHWPATEDVEALLRIEGFDIKDHSLIFYGYCPDCTEFIAHDGSETHRGGDEDAKR